MFGSTNNKKIVQYSLANYIILLIICTYTYAL